MTDKLQQAIDAIEAGDKETGQQLLVQLIKAEPKNVQAWLLPAPVGGGTATEAHAHHTMALVAKEGVKDV